MRDSTKAPDARIVKCPSCKKSARYDETNPFRPFCSGRCKNSDIASWATESYRVAGKSIDPEAVLEEEGRRNGRSDED